MMKLSDQAIAFTTLRIPPPLIPWDSWVVCAHTFHCQLLYVSKYATGMTPPHSEWNLERSHSLRCFPGHWLTFRIPCKTQEHKCPNEMFSIPHSLSGRLHSIYVKSGNSCRSRIWPRQSRRTCPTVPRRRVALTTSALGPGEQRHLPLYWKLL